jgi:hypothetical protein
VCVALLVSECGHSVVLWWLDIVVDLLLAVRCNYKQWTPAHQVCVCVRACVRACVCVCVQGGAMAWERVHEGEDRNESRWSSAVRLCMHWQLHNVDVLWSSCNVETEADH